MQIDNKKYFVLKPGKNLSKVDNTLKKFLNMLHTQNKAMKHRETHIFRK